MNVLHHMVECVQSYLNNYLLTLPMAEHLQKYGNKGKARAFIGLSRVRKWMKVGYTYERDVARWNLFLCY